MTLVPLQINNKPNEIFQQRAGEKSWNGEFTSFTKAEFVWMTSSVLRMLHLCLIPDIYPWQSSCSLSVDFHLNVFSKILSLSDCLPTDYEQLNVGQSHDSGFHVIFGELRWVFCLLQVPTRFSECHLVVSWKTTS